jgi:hypothetical protein
VGEVLGGLANLPVSVAAGAGEGGLDVGPVERGQGDDGPPADRGPVAGGGQHGGLASGVADGTEGGDGRLPHEPVVVSAGQPGQPNDGSRFGRAALTAGPGRRLGNRRVRVVEQRQQGNVGGSTVGVGTERGDHLHGSAPDPRVTVGDGSGKVVDGQPPGPVQRPQGGGPHAGIGVTEEPASGGDVAFVAGHGRSPPRRQRSPFTPAPG